MIYEIKRIPPGPVIKVSFFVFLFVGFVIGLFYGFIIINLLASLGGLLNGEEEIFSDYANMGIIGIIMMGIVISIISSVIMTALTGLSVVCYNVIAGMLGGVKLELTEVNIYEPHYNPPPQRSVNPPPFHDSSHTEDVDER